MVVGFLRGLWGKPASGGTGLVGIWGSVTKAPKSIIGAVMTPFKIIAYIIVIIIGLLVYKRVKK